MVQPGLSLQQNLSQKLKLTPSLRQGLKVLQLGSLDLGQHIEAETQENPFLEMIQLSDLEQGALGAAEKAPDPAKDKDNSAGELGWENSFNNSSWENTRERRDNPDSLQQFLEGTQSYSKTLPEHLEEQLPYYLNTEQDKEVARHIIGSLDERGFLVVERHILLRETKIPLEYLDGLLHMVQHLEPLGLATANVQESLFVQARELYPHDELLARLIVDSFDHLDRDREELALELSVPAEELESSWRRLSSLEPYPAYEFAGSGTHYIIPDAEISVEGDELSLRINDQWLPQVKMNESYLELLKQERLQNRLSQEDQDFLNDKKERASTLLWSLDRRKQTLQQLLSAVMAHQKEFFFYGPRYLRPLTMQQVADELNLDLSSVSRAVSHKYVATPWGNYALKDLFPRPVLGQGDSAWGQHEIEQELQSIIQQETKPLSDSKIVEKLKDKGITISRRAVAKYRDQLGIPPSTKRGSRKAKG
jgi:RNA polymerase sigma-54 factor